MGQPCFSDCNFVKNRTYSKSFNNAWTVTKSFKTTRELFSKPQPHLPNVNTVFKDQRNQRKRASDVQ